MLLDSTQYWIWLRKAFGPQSRLACNLVRTFGSPQEVHRAGRDAWLESGILNAEQCRQLAQLQPSELCEHMLAILPPDMQLLTPDDPLYPALLPELPDYPLLLFARGQTEVLARHVLVAIVGTRTATAGGRRAAQQFGRALAAAGAVVVSGGALGIDTAAHEGALAADGETVLVMGCGLDHPYLRENDAMRTQIAQGGVLLSEYAPNAAPSRKTFPMRNRIIAGMCQCTVVVEAAAHSGSLITAGYASKGMRSVFVVPSSVTGSYMRGAEALLGSHGVFEATTPEDVLRILRSALPAQPVRRVTPATGTQASLFTPAPAAKPTPAAKPASAPEPSPAPRPAWLEGDVLRIFELLQKKERLSPDEIVQATGLPVGTVLAAISRLEMSGMAEHQFGSIQICS